jgi:hypothetical protein
MEYLSLLHNQLQQVFLIQELELLDLLQLVLLLLDVHQCEHELHEFPDLQLLYQVELDIHIQINNL